MKANEESFSNEISSKGLLWWRELWNDIVEELLGEIGAKWNEKGEDGSDDAVDISGWSDFEEELL